MSILHAVTAERLGFGPDSGSSHETHIEAQLRRNVEYLVRQRKMSKKKLAELMGNHGESWLSKRLSGQKAPKGSRFQLRDVVQLSHIFELSPAVLLLSSLENWDRRTGSERRSGFDRRQQRYLGP